MSLKAHVPINLANVNSTNDASRSAICFIKCSLRKPTLWRKHSLSNPIEVSMIVLPSEVTDVEDDDATFPLKCLGTFTLHNSDSWAIPFLEKCQILLLARHCHHNHHHNHYIVRAMGGSRRHTQQFPTLVIRTRTRIPPPTSTSAAATEHSSAAWFAVLV